MVFRNDQKLSERTKSKIGDHQVILINNTQDDISDFVKIISGTKLIDNPKNLGFAAGVNQGIKLVLSDQKISTILLLNNDLTITHGSLNQLLLTFAKFPPPGSSLLFCITEVI